MPPGARGPRRPAAGWAGGSRARPARPPAPGCRDSGAQYVGSRDAGLVRTGGSQRCRGAQSLPNGKSGRRVTLQGSGVSVLHIGRKCKDTKTSRKETRKKRGQDGSSRQRGGGGARDKRGGFPRKWGAAWGCWGPGCTGKAGALSMRLGDRFRAHATPSRHRFPRVSAGRQQDRVAFSSALGFTALLRTWEDTPGDGGASTYNLPGTRGGQGCFRRRAADPSCIRDCEGCAFLCPLGLEYVFQVCVSDGPQLTLRRSP